MHQKNIKSETTGFNKPKKTPFVAPALIIQKKLEIGDSDDKYEVEADRMADEVVRMNSIDFDVLKSTNTTIQRKCKNCEEEHIQKKALVEQVTPLIQKRETNLSGETVASKAVTDRINQSRGKGNLLSGAVKRNMESGFGADFSNVRIHTDSNAVQLSKSLNAQAFTVGNDIYFNQGKYDTSSNSGKHLLAHELTHTIQQSGQLRTKIQKRGPAVRPAVRRPPVRRPPTRNQTMVDGSPQAPTSVPYHQRYAPPPNHDNSLHALMFRASVANAREQMRYDLEQPVATLERGGAARNRFISTGSPREYNYIAEGHGGRISYTPHYYHVLDAIEFAVSSANTEQQILLAITQNLPGYFGTLLDINPQAARRSFFNPFQSGITIYGHPIFPEGLDPGGISRTTVLMTALATKTQTQPELIRQSQVLSALIEAEDFALDGRNRRRQGACNFRNIPNRGGHRAHDLYASYVASDRGYGPQNDELEVSTPEGISYAFDVYSPDYSRVWEVKTRHEWTSDTGMPRAPYMPHFSERIIAMDFQRLRGLYVADRCGLTFKYAFDNCDTALGMRTQWSNIPPIEYIPFPGEPRLPCTQLTDDD